jgi:hypothetical protein
MENLMKPIKKMLPLMALSAILIGLSQSVWAGTLENMERERAILLEALLSGDLDVAERQGKIDVARRRLVDLERMVLRDKTLMDKNTPAVRAAFENYDLSFLVHASVEKNRGLADHWLSEIGISTQTLMNARMGRR